VDDSTTGATRPEDTLLPEWARTIGPDTIDRRIVHERFWIDRHAYVWQIPALATGHIEAVIGMLQHDLADWLYETELLEALIREIAAAEQGTLGEEGLMAALGLPTIANTTPLDWLESTELVRALRCELRRRDFGRHSQRS
jgi:hypothetical protein